MTALDAIAGTARAGTLYGIGVGPGDVRYLTLRAAALVRDVVNARAGCRDVPVDEARGPQAIPPVGINGVLRRQVVMADDLLIRRERGARG